MLDLLREARNLMYKVSAVHVFGIPVDWFFHLVGAILIVFASSRFWSLGRVVRLALGLVLAK